MDFRLDETAEAVVQAVAGALAGDLDADAAWKALGQGGLLTLSVPAELGGAGLGVLASMTVLTEIGRRGLSLPGLATLALGVLPVVRWGSAAQKEELLSGSPVLTAALRSPGGDTTCSPEGQVYGTKVAVAYADRARALLVPVSLTAGGTAVALVDPSANGVVLTSTPSSSGTPEWTVTFEGAFATGLLSGGARAVADLHLLALAGAAALGDGVVSGSLALTSAHVGSRVQFGRRLAEFQAVSQQIADVYIAARTLHLATLSACWRLDEGLDAQSDVDVAAYWLASQGPAAVRTCHHLHGGLGLDASYPLHRYSALVKDLVRFVGGVEERIRALEAHGVH